MIRFNPRNTPWLIALSIMMSLVVISGDVAASSQAILLTAFMAAVALSFIDLSQGLNFKNTLQQRNLRSRMSAEAREAHERAAQRPNYRDLDKIWLVDVGLIASSSGEEGLVMRRTRSVSKDDDGVRPFVTLHIPPSEADTIADLRFEIIDHSGREQYIHERDIYLKDGEMNIITDNHLALRKNEFVSGRGDWDLRVYLNGALVAMHEFALTASYSERQERLRRSKTDKHYVGTGDVATSRTPPQEEKETPLSLEELLRNQGKRAK